MLPPQRCHIEKTMQSRRCRLNDAVSPCLDAAVSMLPSRRCRLDAAVSMLPSRCCRLDAAVSTMPFRRCLIDETLPL